MLKEIHRRDPQLSIVLITAYGSIDMARAAFKNGAMDYITKPWSNDELLAQVAQAVESRRLRDENVDRKSTRLNSSHTVISYAVFCLKKKKQKYPRNTNHS